ncbi:MAG: S1C family serine protease [Rubripirellula sp.]
MSLSFLRCFPLQRQMMILLSAAAFTPWTVAHGQDTRTNQHSVSIRQQTSAPTVPSATTLNAERERLYNELAEEFAAFNRLGNLVRRVSTLVKPSVIHIEAHKTEERGGTRESYDEAGSGVVLQFSNDEYWVLTNRHVVEGAKPSEILLRSSSGTEFYPEKVLSDASTDVAVMKIKQPVIPAARLGDSSGVGIGDFVIAIGSPFGLSHSVTFGILSAKGRRDLSLGAQKIDLQDFFQTDAAINPGNSGGPLLNLLGEVIGLNTAIASSSGGSEGIGFAIPINMAMRVAEQLIQNGRLRRGYLGVTLDPNFSVADLATAGYGSISGALVKEVRAGSPAAKARLRSGDIIVLFNGDKVENDDHLVTQVGLTEVGDSIPMIILREGKRYRTDVTLTDLM